MWCRVPKSSRWITLIALSLTPALTAFAQVTNWVAYNDHRPSAAPVNWPVTSARATGYDMGAPADTGPSPLVNFVSGDSLPATVSFTRTGAPDDYGTVGRPVRTNTPMGALFLGICDLSNDGLVGVNFANGSSVTTTFAGLDPTKRYVFRGSVARNGGYGTRWSLAAINAAGSTDAHINGDGGPGVLTINTFPASALAAGQAAWNSGANNEGAVVGWNDIAPFEDGTFTITTMQYTGAIPGGTANGPYGYGFGAMMIAEVEIVAPTITAQPASSITVEQNRPLTLSVTATGAPLMYQWYKEGVGPIPGATLATYSVPQAQVSDSGNYHVVVFNSLASQMSSVAQVTVFADTTAPAVEAIFSYPNVDTAGFATQDQIIIEFNEPVTAESVNSAASYIVPGGGNPVSVVVTNERSVVLTLAVPLGDDTEYSVTLSGATDAVGNVAASSAAPFRSWAPGVGNGLVMDSYDVADPAITVESLEASENYPDSPFRSDLLRAFDSRLVFPDDTREGYGARIRGVFVPPVSGDWVFFARTRNLGLVRLNPNGIDPAGAVEILRQSTENAPFNWDRLSSSLFSLRAGKPYYIEGLYKGATGPDYLKVAARLAGTGFPTPVDTLDTEIDPNSLTGAIICYPLAPRDLGGTLTIAQGPANTTVEENHYASFSVDLNNPGNAAVFYQWYRDGSPIPGGNTPVYSFIASQADSGATFSVQVSKVGSAATSGSATLTVVPDTTPPRALSATVNATDLTQIVVEFDEIMFQPDLEDNFNYSIVENGNNPSTAVQGAGSTSVTLTFNDPLDPGSSYNLSVALVTDLAGLGISPDPTILPVQFAGGGAPALTIALTSGQAVITWPAPSTGFVLEQADAIVLPVTSIIWTAVGTAPTVVNGMNSVTLPVSGNKVFRLRQ